MDRLRLALVVVENNDFQQMQVVAARETAQRLGIDLNVIPIEYDAVVQSQEVLSAIQGPDATRPHGIMFEPVGTTLARPASVAASKGIGWAVLSRPKVEYIPELRAQYQAPMFSASSSHYEVGRLQGEQLSRLIPDGGTVLYIEGPATNEAAVERSEGMKATKPENVIIRPMKGLWTEISGYQAIASFLRVRGSSDGPICAVAAQNDAMALGARRAFKELTSGEDQKRYLSLPFLGCDGIPSVGQAAVRSGQLAATVVIPPNAANAVETLAAALRHGKQAPEQVITEVSSYPALSELKPLNQQRTGTATSPSRHYASSAFSTMN